MENKFVLHPLRDDVIFGNFNFEEVIRKNKRKKSNK